MVKERDKKQKRQRKEHKRNEKMSGEMNARKKETTRDILPQDTDLLHSMHPTE